MSVAPRLNATARAPLRVDLTGGYTDCEPFASMTVSHSISVTTRLFAAIECTPTGERSSVELWDAHGSVYSTLDRSVESLKSDPGIGGLIGRAVAFFGQNADVSIRVDAPLGSGLGTSGAIMVGLTRAMLELVDNQTVHKDSIPHLAAAFERVAGQAGGLQDQLAAVNRGFAAYRFDHGRVSILRFGSVPSFLGGAVLAFPPPEQRRIGSGNLVSLVTESWRSGSRETRHAIRHLARVSNELYTTLIGPAANDDAVRGAVTEILGLQRSLHPEIRRGIDETPIWQFVRQHELVGKPLGGAGRGAAWLLLRPLPRELVGCLSREGWSTVPLKVEQPGK